MPQRDIFQGRGHVAADHASKTSEVLRQDRVALVRHRRASLLARCKIFLRLKHFRALEMTDFRRKAFDGRGDHAERCKEHGVTVTGDNLCRDWLDLKAELGCDMLFDLRRYVREGSDRTRYRTSPHRRAQRPSVRDCGKTRHRLAQA